MDFYLIKRTIYYDKTLTKRGHVYMINKSKRAVKFASILILFLANKITVSIWNQFIYSKNIICICMFYAAKLPTKSHWISLQNHLDVFLFLGELSSDYSDNLLRNIYDKHRE